MAKKKGNDYFELLAELVDYTCAAASLLNDTLSNFNLMQLQSKIDEMHKIEHTADLKKHEMMNKLVKEFITPIERGDIIELSHEIDNVTDAIEDILVKIYIFNIKSMRQEALEFCNLILKSCDELKVLMKEFKNFKKSANIYKIIVNINELEEEGDRLYTKVIRNLYINSKDPIELISWKDTFEYFEKCCDSCEDAANVIESIIMKNS
jgi:predicted phosphate transport protein (TIGR00153 family)